MCQSCQLIHDVWSLDDDPWILHAVQKPTCDFLQQHMDHGLINDIKQYRLHMNNSPNEEEINNEDIERLFSINININLIIIFIFSLADNEEDEEEDVDCIFIEARIPQPSTSSSLGPQPSTSSSLGPQPSTSSSLGPQPSTSSTDTSTNGGLCVICYVAKSVYAAIPCGHLLMCENCKCDTIKCYICQHLITRVIRIYYS